MLKQGQGSNPHPHGYSRVLNLLSHSRNSIYSLLIQFHLGSSSPQSRYLLNSFVPFDVAACFNNLFHMFISFSVKRFGPRLLFYLLFPGLSILSLLACSPRPLPRTHPPRSVDRGQPQHAGSWKDGRGLWTVIPGCRPSLGCRG